MLNLFLLCMVAELRLNIYMQFLPCILVKFRMSLVNVRFILITMIQHLLQVIYMMEVQDLRQWPIDDIVLVLQQGHRSRAVWQANVSVSFPF